MIVLRNNQTVQAATSHTKDEVSQLIAFAVETKGVLVLDTVDDKPEVKDSCICIPYDSIVFMHVIAPDRSGIVIAGSIPQINLNDRKIN